MFTIQTRNAISESGLSELAGPRVSIDPEANAPDGILLRSANLHGVQLPSSVKAIARAGAGVNNIPVETCTAQGIVVFNTPGANANAVKELVIASLLLSGRRVSEGISWARSLADTDGSIEERIEKEKKQFAGPEIAGKTLGIVGLGAIGVMVANAASELGMRVVGYDPYISVNAAWGLRRDVERADTFDDLLARSDYITLHAPLTESTTGLIGADALSKVKRGVRVINLARGPLVDDEAMISALDTGIVVRYVTDFPTADLVGHSSVIPIPHLGASTPESEENCAVMAARQLRDFLFTGNIVNSVNFPSCTMPVSDDFRVVIANRNVPNMVGQITQVLADQHANISDMLNRHRDGIAYNIIDVEEDLSESSIERLRSIDGVITVRAIGRRQQ
ncbi:MAG: phosphoglycerate dehydrogenase [Spirochaetales bacterium]